MAKRGLSVDDTKSPSKKRAKSGGQIRLDTFFSTSPVKPRLTQSNTSSSTAQPRPSSSQPIVIDVDALDATNDDLDSMQSSQPTRSSTPKKGKVKEPPRPAKNTESTPLVFSSLDIDPVYYSPEEQPWLENDAPYAFLAHALSTLAQTRSRIAITNTLTNCFHTIIVKHPESLLPSLYLLSNTLAPPYAPVELGLGPSIISRAIQNVSGVTPAALKRLYNSLGDPGDVAVSAKSNLRTLIPHPPLTISSVYNSLLKIAHSKGQGAAKQKEKVVDKLLLSASGEEVRYLTRTLCQNIRVGAVRTSMLTALARAIVLWRTSDEALDGDSGFQASTTLLAEVRKSSLDVKKKALSPSRIQLNSIFSRAEAVLRGVYVRHPNYGDIASALLDTGLLDLDGRVPLTIGIPLHPTLGSPMRSLDEVYERMGDQPFVAEFKYDGQRAQVHATTEDGKIVRFKVFSRHLEDMTSKYPDLHTLVASLVQRTPSIKSFILDSEVVAIDPRSGAIKSFQELSNRAKKDVQLKDIQVSVCLYAFDLMYFNGKALLHETFRKRRALLHAHFLPYISDELGSARFAHVASVESQAGRDEVEDFWQQSIQSQTEGLMIKLLDNAAINDEGNGKESSRKKPLPATYEPDKRTAAWLKLKKDYVTGIGDSLDLVPIGAWYGSGRKVKWWSPILMGLYDDKSGKYVAVCKCMSGFTDKFYQDLRNRYTPSDEDQSMCSVRPLWECEFGGFRADVYFRPSEVWEIRGADITLSPVSAAARGLVSSSRGLSLRFPRFMKIREDKSIEHASTPEFLASVWRKQQGPGHQELDEGDDLLDVDLSAHSDDELSEEEL